MKTSQNGKALIQAFESCLKRLPDGRYTTYRCPANVTTIGWGTTASDVPGLKDGEIWTKTRCDDVFAASLAKYEKAVTSAADGASLSQNQFDALVSIAYNCGPGVFGGSIGSALRSRNLSSVPALMARWNKAGGKVLKGLVRRREAEGLMFAGDIDGAFRVAGISKINRDPMPQAVDKASPGASDVSKKAAAPAAGLSALVAAAWAMWDSMPLLMQIVAVLALCVTGAVAFIKVSSAIRRMREAWS